MSYFHHRSSFVILYVAIAILFAYSAYLTVYQALVSDRSKTPPLDLTRGELDEICRPFEDKFTIDKFMMFATDCWPSKEAKDVFDHYKEHAKTYIVDIPGAKYSHAIYTAYLTGQLPTNYKGDPIVGDHLARSLNRSPIHRNRTNYIGPEWCFLALFGKDEYNTTFADVRIENEPLDVNYEHVYPWFFERAGFMTSYFNQLVESNRSMMTHSGELASLLPGRAVCDVAVRVQLCTTTDSMASTEVSVRRLSSSHTRNDWHAARKCGTTACCVVPHTRVAQADFKSVKAWFDSHPDYTLILFSDHGVDQYDITGYRMHGLTENGNEPFILIYNSRLESNNGPLRIDVVDVAPTLSQYFRGPIDIPANSIGISRTHLSDVLSGDNLRLACRNALQLLASAQHRKVSADASALRALVSDALKLMLTPPTPGNNATITAHERLHEWMDDLKQRMYSVIHMPWFELIFYALLAMFATLAIVVFNNPRLDAFILRDEVRKFAWELTRMFGMYTVCYVQMMFIYDGWAPAHFGAKLWRTVVFVTTLSLLRVLDVLPATPPLAYVRWALYRNAFVVLSGMIGMDLLYELVDILNEETVRYYFGRVLTFAVAIWVIRSYYDVVSERRASAYAAARQAAHTLSLTSPPRAPRSLVVEKWVVIVLVAMIHVFAFTSENAWFFTPAGKSWYHGWHVLALLVYMIAGVLLPVWLLAGECGDVGVNGELIPHNGLERLVVPVNVVLLLLNVESITNSLWLALFNWQMHAVALPIAALIKQAQMHAQAPQIVARLMSGPTRGNAGLLSVASQLAALYALCMPFVTMSIFFKDVINFDVHPFAGRIGQKDYDNRPMLCALLMVLHKYGPFVLYAIYSISLARRPQTLGPDARLGELAPPPPTTTTTTSAAAHGSVPAAASVHRRRADAVDSAPTSAHATSMSAPTPPTADALSIAIEPNEFEWAPTPELAAACVKRHVALLRTLDAQFYNMQTVMLLSLFVAMTNIGLYLMFLVISSFHPREAALAQALVSALLVVVHCTLRAAAIALALFADRTTRLFT